MGMGRARGKENRWARSTATLLWEPFGGKRRVGRPVTRWRDDLDSYTMAHFNVGENDWILLAADREGWDGPREQ